MPTLGYNPVESVSPLGGDARPGTVYQSPATYSQTWEAYHGDLGYPEIEMRENPRPNAPVHQLSQDTTNSNYSDAPTLHPASGQQTSEQESFLHNNTHPKSNIPFNPHDPPYKDHAGRQFRHIVAGMSVRWFITAGLCVAYVVSTNIYKRRGPQSETDKKVYNTITTAISIALGLNVASAFKDIALNMRWRILNSKKRSLQEIDLILGADSMMKVGKMIIVSKTPLVIFACLSWLFINILAQAGIAMVSLTYGWNTDYSAVLLQQNGNVSVANMTHFFPQGSIQNFTSQDERYTAHLYGGLIEQYGINYNATRPTPESIYDPTQDALLWNGSDQMDFVFIDSPTGVYSYNEFSIFTNRFISINPKCLAYPVTANGNGSFNTITVQTLGSISVSEIRPQSTTYFINTTTEIGGERCGDRCSVVEVFEASTTNPFYYRCNITVQKTLNDPKNVTYVSDDMAYIAGSAIADIGYSDDMTQEAQIYPPHTPWGLSSNGNATHMAKKVSAYALGSIAGASFQNPSTWYIGTTPSAGAYLEVGHRYFFYMIIGLIAAAHLILLIIVASLANKAKIGPEGHVEMSLLLMKIAEGLEKVRRRGEEGGVKRAMKGVEARYEEAGNGRWVLNTI